MHLCEKTALQDPKFYYDGPCWDETDVIRFDDLPLTGEGKSQALMWSGNPEVLMILGLAVSLLLSTSSHIPHPLRACKGCMQR